MSQENQVDPTLHVTSPPEQEQTTIEKPEFNGSKSEIIQPKNEEESSPPPRTLSPPRSSQDRKNVLSPKSSGSRRPQSPGVFKGKLEIVKKFLGTEQEKHNKLSAEIAPLNEEKESLQRQLSQREQTLLKSSASEEKVEQDQKEIQELKRTNAQISHKIESLQKVNQQKLITEKQIIKDQISNVKAEIAQKEKEDQDRKKEAANKLQQLKSQTNKIEEQIKKEEAHIVSKETETKKLVQDNCKLTEQKQRLKKQIDQQNSSAQNEKAIQEKRKAQLEIKIKEARERINLKKKQIQSAKAAVESASKSSNQKNDELIKDAKKKGQVLAESIKKAQAEIQSKKSEAKLSKEDEKKKEQKVKQMKRRIQQNQKKKDELINQLKEFESPSQKKIQYQQKVPQDLLAIKSKNEVLRKQSRKINQKIENERLQMQRLVPPAVIENMNKKISNIIYNNQKANQVSQIIEELTKQNQILAEERDKLEWGQNNYLNELDSQNKKQLQKNRLLEEQLQVKKKNIQQLNARLEQYVHAYPQFKPKKKPQTKKEEKLKKSASAISAEEQKSPGSDPKKKKGSVSNLTRTTSTMNEEEKKGGKKKKKSPEFDEIKEEEKVEEKPAPKVETKKADQPKKKKKR